MSPSVVRGQPPLRGLGPECRNLRDWVLVGSVFRSDRSIPQHSLVVESSLRRTSRWTVLSLTSYLSPPLFLRPAHLPRPRTSRFLTSGSIPDREIDLSHPPESGVPTFSWWWEGWGCKIGSLYPTRVLPLYTFPAHRCDYGGPSCNPLLRPIHGVCSGPFHRGGVPGGTQWEPGVVDLTVYD